MNRLKLAILNDSQQVLKLLCTWLSKRGHACTSAVVADMPLAHIQVEKFICAVEPDVVVYDVAMPYASSWDLLSVIRALPSMKSQRFVITTPNKRELDKAIGRNTSVLEVAGQPSDMDRLVKAVERAAMS